MAIMFGRWPHLKYTVTGMAGVFNNSSCFTNLSSIVSIQDRGELTSDALRFFSVECVQCVMSILVE